ncbi:MAG: prolyl-tRNA synthetase associated domain-containing protein [Alphaproteobacteria bacterium]|nr:prolyl-tRNA synthetase associated domain-containing protein [Alphaproteobacteria bacterium]
MPATREDLLSRLEALGIQTQTRDHPPVFTVEEARKLRGEIPGGHCKNLFLKDDKGGLWLVVCLEDAQIDLKAAPAKIGSRRLSFGKPDLLMEALGVETGSVTPFAVINDAACRVNVVLDAAMMAHDRLNFHPLRNDATTTIAARDLVTFIESCGHRPRIVPVA